ncbi:MAG: PilZ domain-containing protein [Pseudomonadota bacterium]
MPSDASYSERRREPRHHLRASVEIFGSRDGFAQAQDINTCGIRIETGGPLPPAGKVCRLRFRLSPTSGLLAASAKVIWARRVSPRRAQAGLGFLALVPSAQAIIARFTQTPVPEAG